MYGFVSRNRSGVVLDPCGGTGTTALVARALDGTGVTVDLFADYCRTASWRTIDAEQLASDEWPLPPIIPDEQAALFEVYEPYARPRMTSLRGS